MMAVPVIPFHGFVRTVRPQRCKRESDHSLWPGEESRTTLIAKYGRTKRSPLFLGGYFLSVLMAFSNSISRSSGSLGFLLILCSSRNFPSTKSFDLTLRAASFNSSYRYKPFELIFDLVYCSPSLQILYVQRLARRLLDFCKNSRPHAAVTILPPLGSI